MLSSGGYGGNAAHKRRNGENGDETEKTVVDGLILGPVGEFDATKHAARSAARAARGAAIALLRSASVLSVSPFVNSVAFVFSVAALTIALASPSFAQMPDVRQMSGVPLPVSDVAPGTVTVRVIRGSLANVVPGQDVELMVGGASRKGKTNDAGRAEFNGLAPGTRVKAVTVVDGVRIESQEFDVPATGGVRLMLVAAAPSDAAAGAPGGATAPSSQPQAPAQAGTVSLGEQTRFVFEMGDEALTGFYILQIVNATPTPVQPATVFTLDLPEAAEGAAMMQGSSPQGSVAGRKVVVSGPFAPGQTQVQVAFSLPYSTGELAVVQKIPVPLARVTLLLEKVGGMNVESPQIAERREVKAENNTYILGQGAGIKAGEVLTLTVSGLPHRALWPRNLALALAALIVGAGVWASVRPGRAATAERERREELSARRDRLFSELAGLEEQQRSGAVSDDRYQARRAELVRALERVYGELDEEAAA
jgi:hypothetical protein